jgi:hypothetical protein
METTLGDFVRHYGSVAREACTAEVEKIFAENHGGYTLPEVVNQGGHYFVTTMGEILCFTPPCAVNREASEVINHFCAGSGWGYEVLPCLDAGAAATPLRIVFHTGFFVSPA